MKEEDIRRIVRDEMSASYGSGKPFIDRHTHDGADNTQIPSVNIIGFSPLPSGDRKYRTPTGGLEFGFASPQTLRNSGTVLEGNAGALYPLPIIAADAGLSGFQGGYAPEGTMTLFIDPLVLGQAQLWTLIRGVWYGVNLSTTP